MKLENGGDRGLWITLYIIKYIRFLNNIYLRKQIKLIIISTRNAPEDVVGQSEHDHSPPRFRKHYRRHVERVTRNEKYRLC